MPPLLPPITIHQATRADWPRFAQHHYRQRPPGPLAAAFIAHVGGREAGYVALAYPGLACAARREHMPDDLWRAPLKLRAQDLNARVRVITRLVVLPEFQNRGIGALLALVAATEGTTGNTVEYVECISARGGFLTGAGFQDCGSLPLPPALQRLRDLLAAMGVDPAALAARVEQANAGRARPLGLREVAGMVPPRSRCAASETHEVRAASHDLSRFDATGGCRCASAEPHLPRILRSALRAHTEAVGESLRGTVRNGTATPAALARIPDLLTRLASRPHYFLWRKEAGRTRAGDSYGNRVNPGMLSLVDAVREGR